MELILDDEARPTAPLTQVEDLPPLPYADHRWGASFGAGLMEVVRGAELPMWPVHRANDLEPVVIAPDDLGRQRMMSV